MSSRERKVVRVGSTNPVKINACKEGFSKCFPDTDFDVQGVNVPSGVPDQPFGDPETRLGACNRAFNLATKLQAEGVTVDFTVGLEGGCAWETATLPAAEGLVEEKCMTCFAWMAVFHPASKKWGYARSGSLNLPKVVSDLVESGVELGLAGDQVFSRSDTKHGSGVVGLLTKGEINRTQYYVHALILALTPFMMKEYY